MDFTRLKPQEVITPEAMPRYNRAMLFFSLQLTHLSVNIFILERVLSFPFRLLVPPEDTLFFRMVVQNFLDAAVLAITRLAADQGTDVFTLPKFKNWILQVVRPDLAIDFQAHLRQLRFDSSTQDLLRSATLIRDRHIAHNLREPQLEPAPEEVLTFAQIKQLQDRLSSLLAGLAFDTEYFLLPLQYDPRVQHPAGHDSRADIEKLLDLVARNSYVLNLPENRPEWWQYDRLHFSPEELNILNSYRAKFGLMTV